MMASGPEAGVFLTLELAWDGMAVLLDGVPVPSITDDFL